MTKVQRIKPKRPKIYTRKSWQALPGGGLLYRGDLSEHYYRVTLHHDAASAPPDMSLQEALRHVKRHQETHMYNFGWSDLGYHYLIAPGGEIIEGRPLNVKGAHVEHQNNGNVGLCLMGQLHLHKPTKRQIDSLKRLYTWLCWDLYLDSQCLKGHLDYMPTACPGMAYLEIPGVRAYCKNALTHGQEEEAPAQPDVPSLTLDGKPLGDVMIVDGVSFAPVRLVAEALGLKAGWNPETKTVELVSA